MCLFEHTLAEEWLLSPLHSNPVVGVELSKIILSDAKLEASPPEALALAAHKILQSEKVSPSECLASAKVIVRSDALMGNGIANVQALVDTIATKHGERMRIEVTHGLGIAAKEVGDFNLGRDLFTSIVEDSQYSDEARLKARWALAKLENEAGNPLAAAPHFLVLAESPGMPSPLKIQSLRYWFQSLLSAGETDEASTIGPRLEVILAEIVDSQPLLDTGRQLSLMPSEVVGNFRDQVYDRAEEVTWQEFEAASTANLASGILLRLFRRLHYDFNKNSAVIRLWNSLSEAKKQWLSADTNEWWELVAIVHDAYAREGLLQEASALASSYLIQEAASPLVKVWLGTAQANWNIRFSSNYTSAFNHFNWLKDAAPNHVQSSWAYYWLGVAAWKNGDYVSLPELGRRLRRCFAGAPSFDWQWLLDASGCLFQAEVNIDVTLEAFPNEKARDYLEQVLLNLERDRSKLN